MLRSLMLYLKGMRTTMFQLSGFYCKSEPQKGSTMEPQGRTSTANLTPQKLNPARKPKTPNHEARKPITVPTCIPKPNKIVQQVFGSPANSLEPKIFRTLHPKSRNVTNARTYVKHNQLIPLQPSVLG